MKSRSKLLTAGILLALSALPAARGASILQTYSGPLPVTLTGTLPNQGTALEQTFTLASESDLTIFTSSYANGGFQTNLVLFDSMGGFITAGIPAGSPDPSNGIVGDSSLMAMNLAAGTYIVALTDFLLNQSDTAQNLSDGFTSNLGDGETFVDANGNTRNGNYSLTIQANSAAIPEPSTLWLAAPALMYIGLRSRRRS